MDIEPVEIFGLNIKMPNLWKSLWLVVIFYGEFSTVDFDAGMLKRVDV